LRRIFWLFFPLLLFADASIEQRIYRSIFEALFPTKQTLRLWSDDRKKIRQIRLIGEPAVTFVDDPEKADILLVFHRTDVGGHQPVLIGRYSLLRVYKDRVVAGFYWKKGRPHLIFFDRGLRRYGMKLPSRLTPYLETAP